MRSAVFFQQKCTCKVSTAPVLLKKYQKNKSLVKPFYESMGKWWCWTPLYFIKKKNEWFWIDCHTLVVFSKQSQTWQFDISSLSVCWVMITWSSVWRAHWWSVCFREMPLKLVSDILNRLVSVLEKSVGWCNSCYTTTPRLN